MELKVLCQCGQKYKFDVEPAGGRMPFAVNCPVCGADGTSTANELLAAQSPAAPAIPVAARPAQLRINSAAAHPVAAATPQPPAPLTPSAEAPARPWLDPAKAVKAPPPENTENLPLGILGGVIAGGVAMMGWYLLARATDHEYGIVAWLVGVVTGLGVRVMGRDSTALLGVIAGICAALAILGGGFLTVCAMANEVTKEVNSNMAGVYDSVIKEAKEVVQLSTDEEIRAYLAKENEIPAAQVKPEEIKEFREVTQPGARAMLSGKTSKNDFLGKSGPPTISFATKFAIFKAALSPFTILWLFFGVGSAYRIATK